MIFTPHGCCGLNCLSPVLCCFADIDRHTYLPIYLSNHIHPTIHPSIYPFYSASKLNEMEGNVLNAGDDDDGGFGYAHYEQSQQLLVFSDRCWGCSVEMCSKKHLDSPVYCNDLLVFLGYFWLFWYTWYWMISGCGNIYFIFFICVIFILSFSYIKFLHFFPFSFTLLETTFREVVARNIEL